MRKSAPMLANIPVAGVSAQQPGGGRIIRLMLIVVLLVAWRGPVVASEPSGTDAVDNAGIEPEIIIRDEKEKRIEEYRVGGRIVMLKVTPKKGVVYYLVDTDGDGLLDTRESELPSDVLVPQWKVFQWK